MSVEKDLTYRGRITAIAGAAGTLAFVTVHPENRGTGLYRLDAETLALDEVPLPRGALALLVVGDTVWVGGNDGVLYRGSIASGPLKPVGEPLDPAPFAFAPLADDRLAVLSGTQIAILSQKNGKLVQALTLPEVGTALASDPTGRWLVAGTEKGTVAVFEAEQSPEFQLSASSPLHEGAVSALLFEPDELRFLSTGADRKLLSTLARGELEPEDKGKGGGHSEVIKALIWGPADRFYSGSSDSTVKNWPRTGGARPSTSKDDLAKVVALALVHVHDRPRLVAACADNSIRIFSVDAAGKIGDLLVKARDVYARAKSELDQSDTARREAAIEELARYDDAASIELIAAQVKADAQASVRLLSVRKLAASDHPRAGKLLEPCLDAPGGPERLAAFEGLRKHQGEAELRPIELALKSKHGDVGCAAVRVLEARAGQDDRAFARLVDTLNAKQAEVRLAALAALESAFDPNSPEASLSALKSKHADVRRQALVRLLQRGLLGASGVSTALSRRLEDDDQDVRRTAFLLLLSTRPPLLALLRQRDPELNRQLSELEGTPPTTDEGAPGRKPKGPKARSKGAKAGADETGSSLALADEDLAPLLQATASRSLDSSLRGAWGLALLGDPRAFGLLLQLSREKEAQARVEVCRALGALDDPRAIERLRSLLHDEKPEVRDAAFSALVQIHQSDPLLAAESGLASNFEDVRRRALQELINTLRNAPGQAVEARALTDLTHALNDTAESVRGEAFKSALNLQLAGGGAGTLRFLMRSIQPTVRREVLTEVMAQVREPWGWDLLLEFFNDPDPGLRSEAFEFANSRTKGLESLEAALSSRYSDLRKRTVDLLIKKPSTKSQALLVKALGDDERGVRLAALDSLVLVDQRTDLAVSLNNPHADVRVRGARVLAQHGDPRVLDPLVVLASETEPLDTSKKFEWASHVELAVEGLGWLGDPAALSTLIPLIDQTQPDIRAKAARALAWIPQASPDTLRDALTHDDPNVRYQAALGLAFQGDTSMLPLLFSKPAGEVLDDNQRLAAALSLGAAGESALTITLDHSKETIRFQAMLVLLLLEWKASRGDGTRVLACLSSRPPQGRLVGARALEALADPAEYLSFLVSLINERDEGANWTISEATIDALGELITHATPLLRARTMALLPFLREKDQDLWDLNWSIHEARFASEIVALKDQAKTRPAAPKGYDREELLDLAFGAYVGLVREPSARGGQGKGRAAQSSSSDPRSDRIRQTALDRLMAMVKRDARFAGGAIPVFVQALGDPNQAVRLKAFEFLKAIPLDFTRLGAEALGAGHTDLGVKGLELLTGGGATLAEQGRAILRQVMLTRQDDLAIEAARLLFPALGNVSVASEALNAAYEPLREQAIGWLAGQPEDDPQARQGLRDALESRYQHVRAQAALRLANRKDPAAFPALNQLLTQAQLPKVQGRFIEAMVALGTPEVPDALLDRLENDPSGTALVDSLLNAVGSFRRLESAARLIRLMERERKWLDPAFRAALAVSGFDQPSFIDLEDEDDHEHFLRARPSQVAEWRKEQFPRHPEILAQLFDRCLAMGATRQLLVLLPEVRWAESKSLEAGLNALVQHPDETLRRNAVEALAWRVRNRGATPEPLRKAIAHSDAVTQFLAAEGLARAGLKDGLNVLMASIDFVSDLSLRRRAVEALGQLADERALDVLLRLANDEGHALQAEAAEAIGHLGRSSKTVEIFKLLERLAQGSGGMAVTAVKGLRWFNTRAGWEVIQRVALNKDCWNTELRHTAFLTLGYHDEPAVRDLLVRWLASNEPNLHPSTAEYALRSARRLFGPDSLEPDYAILRNGEGFPDADEVDTALKRVGERGEVDRIFDLIPFVSGDLKAELSTALLRRDPLPLAEAREALNRPEAQAVELAARVLGRADRGALDRPEPLAEALVTWRENWLKVRRQVERGHKQERKRLVNQLTPCARTLIWASSRHGVGLELIAALALDRPEDREFRPIRLEAVTALTRPGADAATDARKALETVALGNDPEIRALAASAIGRSGGEPVSRLAVELAADPIGFTRMTQASKALAKEPARVAARQARNQGAVLPYLAQIGDVEGLTAVLEDRSLPDPDRLGALEALATLGLEAAEAPIRAVGLAEEEEEELRKAAWRALRRSKRTRAEGRSSQRWKDAP